MLDFLLETTRFRKALLVGTGGGNDICSTTLIAAYLQNRGKQVDIAGVCSPAARHTYHSIPEETINTVSSAKRFIPYRGGVEVRYIDNLLPLLCRQNGLNVQVFNFSFLFGTDQLIADLNRFVKDYRYDIVIAVDVGGDILARGTEDSTILSPLMDFSTLHVLSQLDVPTALVEFGLQTDQELRPAGCSEILSDLLQQNILQATDTIDKNDPEVNLFRSIFDEIKKVRAGNTARMFFKTLDADGDIVSQYHQKYKLFNHDFVVYNDIKLESQYFGKVYTIDLKKLAANRKLAFGYQTPFEQVIKMKAIVDTKTEMDLFWADTGENKRTWIGLPAPQFEDQRVDILKVGLETLEAHADSAIMWDKEYALRLWHSSSNLCYVIASPFVVVSFDSREALRISKMIDDYI